MSSILDKIPHLGFFLDYRIEECQLTDLCHDNTAQKNGPVLSNINKIGCADFLPYGRAKRAVLCPPPLDNMVKFTFRLCFVNLFYQLIVSCDLSFLP